MNEEIKQLQEKVLKLESFIQSLQSANTIPLQIDQSFRERFSNISGIILSNKSASSENVAAVVSVNFGGMSFTTNTVLDNPDGFFQTEVDGNTYYIPYFT